MDTIDNGKLNVKTSYMAIDTMSCNMQVVCYGDQIIWIDPDALDSPNEALIKYHKLFGNGNRDVPSESISSVEIYGKKDTHMLFFKLYQKDNTGIENVVCSVPFGVYNSPTGKDASFVIKCSSGRIVFLDEGDWVSLSKSL
jgi:hypothetical protein